MAYKKRHSYPKEARRQTKRRASFVVNNQQTLTAKFGHSIRVKREELGMTQTALAKLADLNRSYLSELECGLVNISLERAANLAKALNCNLHDLIG